MALEDFGHFGLKIPELDSAILAGRSELFPIRAETHAIDDPITLRRDERFHVSRGNIPEFGGVVPPA